MKLPIYLDSNATTLVDERLIKEIQEEEYKELIELFDEAYNFFNQKENKNKRDDMNLELGLKFNIKNYSIIEKWYERLFTIEQKQFIVDKYLNESIKKLNKMIIQKEKQKKEAWN